MTTITSGRYSSSGRLPREGRVEMVKAGVPRFDTRLEVLYLRQIFAQTAPDAVILVFLPNDLFTNNPLRGEHGEAGPGQPAVVSANDMLRR